MILETFLKGVAVGFAIAFPVGAVGIICIRKALADGRAAAFIAGLGAAVADTFYGAVAALGLGLVSGFLDANKVWLVTGGGLFLVVIGFRTIFHPPVFVPRGESRVGLFRDFISTFFITLTNPATVIAFMALFATFSVAVDPHKDMIGAGELIFGVFVGSSLWWFMLSLAASLVRGHFTPRWVLWLNRISGSCLVAFGAFACVYGVSIYLGLDHWLDLDKLTGLVP